MSDLRVSALRLTLVALGTGDRQESFISRHLGNRGAKMTVDDTDLARLSGLIRGQHPMRDVAREGDIHQPRIADRVADKRRLGALKMLEAFASDHKKLRIEAAALQFQ